MIDVLTDNEIDEVLKENNFGRIGCNDGFNTYVYPVNYLFMDNYIFCHSQAGSKIEIMRRNNRVCFQVDTVIDITHWKSVMILGEYQELSDERDRFYAMKAFIDRLIQLKIHQKDIPAFPEVHSDKSKHYFQNRPIIYRILIEEKSGRFECD